MVKNSKATSGFPLAACSALSHRALGLPEIAISVLRCSSFTGTALAVAVG